MPSNSELPANRTMALVHQPRVGGVSADAQVHTAFCGVETIEQLYARARESGAVEMAGESHRIMDVVALDIRTMSLNPQSGGFEPKRVTHLWRWDTPPERQRRIRCRDGSEVTSSAWQSFPVLTPSGIQNRRGDELQAGDVLVAPNASVREAWPITEQKVVATLTVDEDLAWLAGYFLAAGSLTVFGQRTSQSNVLCLRIDGRRASIDQAAAALARHGARVSPRINSRGRWSIVTTDRAFVPAFAQVVEAVPGEKDNATLPEWVGKSPLSVIAAFLGGLVDAGCSVSVDRRRVVLSTRGSRLARRLTSLLSVLGFDPDLRRRTSEGSTTAEYRVRLAPPAKNDELVAFIGGWVHANSGRLDALRKRAGNGGPARAVRSRSSEIESGSTVVESAEQTSQPMDFYDLTVEGHNNYLAGGGIGKLLAIHSTRLGPSSPIRPVNRLSRGAIP